MKLKLLLSIPLFLISVAATVIGVSLVLAGDLTNGLLVLVFGELVDMPERIAYNIKFNL